MKRKAKRIIYLIIITVVWVFVTAEFFYGKSGPSLISFFILAILWQIVIEFTKGDDIKNK